MVFQKLRSIRSANDPCFFTRHQLLVTAPKALALDRSSLDYSTPLWLPHPLSIPRRFEQDLEKLSGMVHFYVVSAYFY